ncbi:hypothetical protein BKA70DRAFT_1033599, partial [Coprinopsis sp. MPI-PUGE-AT-0042]
LYGQTSAYYGTVEQQGRLTLHLHLMLWISGSLSPQDVRDRLMSGDSDFQKALVEYLESVHQGEFLNGSLEEVRTRVPLTTEDGEVVESHETENNRGYADPTLTLPVPPPVPCKKKHSESPTCEACARMDTWWSWFQFCVGDLLLRSNIHTCKDAEPKKNLKGCRNKDGVCRARFPQEIIQETSVDEEGRIYMKKLEQMVNTFTPMLTYLMRCNTDVTSLSSGTSIKAVISYVTDYVTKPALKTHQIFSSAYDVFQR